MLHHVDEGEAFGCLRFEVGGRRAESPSLKAESGKNRRLGRLEGRKRQVHTMKAKRR